MQQPDSGPVGALVFDPDAAIRLDETLDRLEATARRIDARLALAESGQAGRGLFKVSAVESVSEVASALHETLTSVRDSLREANNAEGPGGRLLADPTAAVDMRANVDEFAEGLGAIADGEGTLGRLVHREEAQITRWVDRAQRITDAAVKGEGLLGALCDESKGEAMERALEGFATTARNVRHSAIVSDADAALDAWDSIGGLDDAVHDLKRGTLRGIRDGLPDKTFTGVLFGIF